MEKNVGTGEAILRITGGLTLIAWATGEMAKDKSPSVHILCAALGAQKVGEGIMRYCPIKDLIVKNKKEEEDSQSGNIVLP
ncbi:YgaP family membrane protein [Alteribacillus iranensis]|uniref:Inner membrane protein YgaP-like transmembrane domain-containing protein n=1 Tax=Alteribacillus iranensis TaxID=930128 RepID=A0A1I2EB06_9BACI|nr:DUF2892 domain-containing protein [Alteribacillus iranensis]SFE89879.1 Protein of unknown function [Alteribacillus iranensis]